MIYVFQNTQSDIFSIISLFASLMCICIYNEYEYIYADTRQLMNYKSYATNQDKKVYFDIQKNLCEYFVLILNHAAF